MRWHHHVTTVALAQAFLMTVRPKETRQGRRLPMIPNVRKYLQARMEGALLSAILEEKDREERKVRILYLTEVDGGLRDPGAVREGALRGLSSLGAR